MVKFATLPIVIMAAFVHLAAAADLCTTGLNYCGSDLIQHGAPEAQVKGYLAGVGYNNPSPHQVDNTLFGCNVALDQSGNPIGQRLSYLGTCRACISTAVGVTDYCDQTPPNQ